MKTPIALAVCGLLVGLLIGFWATTAHAQMPRSDQVRFRLIGDEPMATPDGRSFVSNWKVIVLRDTKSDQCYTAFLAGNAMSVTGPSTCP